MPGWRFPWRKTQLNFTLNFTEQRTCFDTTLLNLPSDHYPNFARITRITKASQTTSATRQLTLNPIGLTKVPSVVMRFPPLLPAISATIRSSRARGQFPRITDNTDTTLTNLNPRNDDDDDDERTGTGFVLMLQSYYSRALFSWLRSSTTATLNDFSVSLVSLYWRKIADFPRLRMFHTSSSSPSQTQATSSSHCTYSIVQTLLFPSSDALR